MRTPLSLLVALALASACGPASTPGLPAARALPQPTEHRLDEDAEERARSGRERWLAELHRASEDTDWRAIERANGAREQARRNALAAAGGGAKVAGSGWVEIGSKNQAGRMHVSALSPDRQTLYSGSSLGGLWKAAPDGTQWTPLGDNLYGGVHDLAVLPGELPGDSEVLVARTGSKSLRVTRDAGLTWETPAGLAGIDEIRGLALLETPVPTLVVCAQRTELAKNKVAIWASTDFGRSFSQRWISPVAGKGWMWIPRTGPASADTIWIARKGEVLRSQDGGWSFQSIGVSDATAGDVRLAGSEGGAPTLYAMLQVAGAWQLWRSDDAGVSWAFVHAPSDYWGALCASIVDPLQVVYGGVEAHRSVDGGATFAKVNGWGQYYGNPAIYLHADIWSFVCQPDLLDPAAETWWVSCDGGVYESTDRLASVSNRSLSGLGVSQYYSTLTSTTDTQRILAGSQDQGYQYGVVGAPDPAGPSTNFSQIISGDYGHLSSSDGSHALVYSTYPGFVLISQGQGVNQLFFADFPATAHSWLPPVVADPLDASAFFFCGDRLWRYTRAGNAWTAGLHSTFDFSTSGASYLSALAFAPGDPQRAYAATDNGRLYHSTDHGLSWQASASSAPGQHYFYGTAIAVNPDDALDAVVGGSGYSTPGVVRTQDGGVTWQPITLGLPSTLVYGLAWSPDGSEDLFAATEAGAYRRDAASGVWSNVMGNQAPATLYWSVEAVEPNLVRFGTYGRGIWEYPVYPTPGWQNYGAGKPNSAGVSALLSGEGSPTLSEDDFVLHVFAGLANKPSILMYSAGAAAIPFQNGTLLLASPVKRGPNFVTDALGVAQVPVPVEPELVGSQRYYQVWYRDPAHPDGTGVGLSEGLVATFGP